MWKIAVCGCCDTENAPAVCYSDAVASLHSPETDLGRTVKLPTDFPYMNSVGSLPAILERIKGAGAPPRFTHEFLRASLGFTSSSDRPIIAVFRQLGFLTSDGTPTDRYHDFRGSSGRKALADGLREGWADIFLSDQKADQKTSSQLQSIFKSVTGKSESVAKKMATTFKALCDQADWTGGPSPTKSIDAEDAEEGISQSEQIDRRQGLALHQDFHVHLPATSDVAVYRAIFRALRDELL